VARGTSERGEVSGRERDGQRRSPERGAARPSSERRTPRTGDGRTSERGGVSGRERDGQRRPSERGAARPSSERRTPRTGDGRSSERGGVSGRERDGQRRPSADRRATSRRPSTNAHIPRVDDDVTIEMLDRATQNELRGLDERVKDIVVGHLVMTGRHLENDPELALRHASIAADKASRLAVVREACGIAAYAAGQWEQAIRELRAAMRIGGTVEFLPLIADCERGLGRPERALEISGSAEASRLTKAGRVELRIVAAGARADMGQIDAALVTLKCAELRDSKVHEWSVGLWYAYADMLERAGRTDDALEWFGKAAAADEDEETDAAERMHVLLS